jgi:hypothetical protein
MAHTLSMTQQTDPATAMLEAAQGSFHPGRHGARLQALRRILEAHPDAHLVTCRDENTGVRFGAAACRRGRCEKIGHTAWSPTYKGTPYQLWAVW